MSPKRTKQEARHNRREYAIRCWGRCYQNGSTHEWVPMQHWDLIITMDDATNKHDSMFLALEEVTHGSFYEVRMVIEGCGLFNY